MTNSTTFSPSPSSSFSKLFMQFLLISTVVLAVFAEIQGAPLNNKDVYETAYAYFPRHVRSPYDVMMLAEKREKLMSGYGWDQCEFSPMSCLLRRRRR